MKKFTILFAVSLLSLLVAGSCNRTENEDPPVVPEVAFYREFMSLYDKVEEINDLVNGYAKAYHNGTIHTYSEVEIVKENIQQAWVLLHVNFSNEGKPDEFSSGWMEVVIYGKGLGMYIFSALYDVESKQAEGVLYNGIVKSTQWMATETMREYEVEAIDFSKTNGAGKSAFDKFYSRIYHEGINTPTVTDDRLRKYEHGNSVGSMNDKAFTTLITSPVVYDYIRGRYTKGKFEFCLDGLALCFTAWYATDGKSSVTITKDGSSVTYPL